MTKEQARAFLTEVFEALMRPDVAAEELGRYFATDYVQIADGKRLDRAAFVDHARELKRVLAGGTVTLETVLADGSTVATRHQVDARKKSGERVRMKVFAFFEIEDGLIRRTEEVTQMLEGAAEDRDLGSRTAH